jgi:hypothetical protein
MSPSRIVAGCACGDMRSRLRAELGDMGAAFEVVALRTRTAAPVPVPKEDASTEELLSTWAQIFQGVCAMVLSCQHDLSDDWNAAEVGTQLSNSRRSSEAPVLPDPGALSLARARVRTLSLSLSLSHISYIARALDIISCFLLTVLRVLRFALLAARSIASHIL